MNTILKTPAELVCPAVSSEEFLTVDDINVYSRIIVDRDILEFLQSSTNIIDTDSDEENEMKNAALAITSSEMRNIMKSKRNYLDAHTKGEMNKKIDGIEKFVDNLTLKKEKISDYFPKTQQMFCFSKYLKILYYKFH
ncbi:hypothetical protein TNCV_3100581 [Trichonephila clavipes]|nr:hypothetical protein TNCV_3100581 [Trichonephila clavipes]